MARKSIIGSIKITKYGTPCKVIEKIDSRNLLVEFQDEYKYRYIVKYRNFLRGEIKNPYDKSVRNVGYLGEHKYSTKTDSHKMSRCYSIWTEMIRRCYIDGYNKAYSDCYVCDEWLCYANFEKWYYENYYEINNEPICIDKDILIKDNKVYSPETCIFVPKSINSFFVSTNNKRHNGLPLGVSKMTKANTYFCSVGCKTYYGFKTKQEAHLKYLQEKNNDFHIKLQNYKGIIPMNIYDLLESINLMERLKDGEYIE